jgi:hypothetical protein
VAEELNGIIVTENFVKPVKTIIPATTRGWVFRIKQTGKSLRDRRIAGFINKKCT